MTWISGALLSWKTTLAGLLGATAILLNTFGLAHWTDTDQATILAAAVLIIGIFSKDANKGADFEDNR